jgi:hypothetical protein
MSNKFLNPNFVGDLDLTNGTVTILAASLASVQAAPSSTLKTNAVGSIVSETLVVSDILDLESQLQFKQDLTFSGIAGVPSAPTSGATIFADTAGVMKSIDLGGVVTDLGGGGGGNVGEFVTIPESLISDPDPGEVVIFSDGTIGSSGGKMTSKDQNGTIRYLSSDQETETSSDVNFNSITGFGANPLSLSGNGMNLVSASSIVIQSFGGTEFTGTPRVQCMTSNGFYSQNAIESGTTISAPSLTAPIINTEEIIGGATALIIKSPTSAVEIEAFGGDIEVNTLGRFFVKAFTLMDVDSPLSLFRGDVEILQGLSTPKITGPAAPNPLEIIAPGDVSINTNLTVGFNVTANSVTTGSVGANTPTGNVFLQAGALVPAPGTLANLGRALAPTITSGAFETSYVVNSRTSRLIPDLTVGFLTTSSVGQQADPFDEGYIKELNTKTVVYPIITSTNAESVRSSVMDFTQSSPDLLKAAITVAGGTNKCYGEVHRYIAGSTILAGRACSLQDPGTGGTDADLLRVTYLEVGSEDDPSIFPLGISQNDAVSGGVVELCVKGYTTAICENANVAGTVNRGSLTIGPSIALSAQGKIRIDIGSTGSNSAKIGMLSQTDGNNADDPVLIYFTGTYEAF